MKDTAIADRLVDGGQHDGPELVKVDIQVRSGGTIVPPAWARPRRQVRAAGSKADIRQPESEG